MADLFDDEKIADPILPETNDWQKLENTMKKEGYREGLAAGQEMSIQTGFNSGYSDSFRTSFQLAKLRGIFCAVMGHNLKGGEQSKLSDADLTQIELLIQQISDLEKSLQTTNIVKHSLEGKKVGHGNDEATSSSTVCLGDINASVGKESSYTTIGPVTASQSSTKETDSGIENPPVESTGHSLSEETASTSSPNRKLVGAKNKLAVYSLNTEIKTVTDASQTVLHKLGLAHHLSI